MTAILVGVIAMTLVAYALIVIEEKINRGG